MLKFSSIVFVKYHVWFLFAEHFDQIELMFVQHNTGPAKYQLRLSSDKAQMERGQLLLVTDTLTTKDGSRAFSNGTGKGALFEKNATLTEVAFRI